MERLFALAGTVGVGHKYGFDMTRVLLIPHGGHHNDTICTVEVKAKTIVDNLKHKPLF